MFSHSNPTGSKICIFYEMEKNKKYLGNGTYRHANDTRARGGGTTRHAIRGGVAPPLRLRGAVVTPMTLPADTRMTRNDTHKKVRVSPKSWSGPRKEKTHLDIPRPGLGTGGCQIFLGISGRSRVCLFGIQPGSAS